MNESTRETSREIFDTLSASHQKVLTNMVVKGLNQTRAYMDAYPESSYDAARDSSSQLLAKPCMKEAYAELKLELKERASVDFDWVLDGLVELAKHENDDGKIDINARKGVYNEINKMLGNHAPAESNLTLVNSEQWLKQLK